MSIPENCTVRFRTERRHDGGLRIYATEPSGLYVSSEHTYAAAEYFQRFLLFVVIDHFTDKGTRTDGGIEMDADFQWESIVQKGEGSCEFRVVAPEVMQEELGCKNPPARETGGDFPAFAHETETPLAEIELKVDFRLVGKKHVVVATDPGEDDTELEAIIKRQEFAQ